MDSPPQQPAAASEVSASRANRSRSRSPPPASDPTAQFERLLAGVRKEESDFSSERFSAFRARAESDYDNWVRRAAEWAAEENALDRDRVGEEVADALLTCGPDRAGAVRSAGRAALESLRTMRAVYPTRAASEARAAAEGLAAAEALAAADGLAAAEALAAADAADAAASRKTAEPAPAEPSG